MTHLEEQPPASVAVSSKPRNSNMKSTRSLTIYKGENTCQQFPKSLDSERRGSGKSNGWRLSQYRHNHGTERDKKN